MVVDSHCHLQSLKPEEREPALDAARERGVRGFLVPAIRLSDAETVLDLCHRHPDVWCALGVHPHEASSWQEGDAGRLRELLADPKAVAVGECGLDFHYDHSPRPVQERVLRAQWELAMELGLPAVVHNRDSDAAMLGLARLPEHAALRADFHSFAGGAVLARELLALGHVLGISGMVTFPKGDNVREALPEAGLDRLLAETDTPYLAPVPYRGRPNRPAWVVEVLERIAAELGATPAEAARRTSATFFRFFDKAAPAFPDVTPMEP